MDSEAEFRRLFEAQRAAVHAYFTGFTAGFATRMVESTAPVRVAA